VVLPNRNGTAGDQVVGSPLLQPVGSWVASSPPGQLRSLLVLQRSSGNSWVSIRRGTCQAGEEGLGWLSSCLAPSALGQQRATSLRLHTWISNPARSLGWGGVGPLLTMSPRLGEASCHPAPGHAPSRWHGLGNPLSAPRHSWWPLLPKCQA